MKWLIGEDCLSGWFCWRMPAGGGRKVCGLQLKVGVYPQMTQMDADAR